MDEPRISFLVKRISQAFRNISNQRIYECITTDPYRQVVNEFLEYPETQVLFLKEVKGSIPIEISVSPMKPSKDPTFYFLKINKSKVSDKDVAKEIIYGDVTGDPLDHMAMMTQRIFYPIVSDEETSQIWSEMIAKETRTNLDSFVSNVQITQGNIQGRTYLPLPHGGLGKDSENDILDDANLMPQIYALESAIIIWTKQIKNVLKQSPEMVLETQHNPGPMAEIMFWKFKSDNLSGIFDQLQSQKVRRVLKVLDKSKSTYNAPFAKICKEVFYAKAAAANITKFLSALSVWCDFFIKEKDFTNVEKYFQPIMHVILLVWKSSPYYNVPSRLVVLLREICNSLITHIEDYLGGDAIMELICAEDSSEALKALESGIRCIGRFKAAYFEYKEKSVLDCPDNPWRMQNNAVFVRLDGFLERCHDILEMAETIAMFTKLLRTDVGVESMRAVSNGILDLSNKQFDEEFYEFRTRIKELDRRLGSVVAQALDDAVTVNGKFRALDTFENMVFRPIIAEELEKKHASLVAAVRQEIEDSRRIFHSHSSSPPRAHNHPPIAGALTWSRGLFERVQVPMDKLKSFDKKILERDDTRETIKLYTVFVGELSDFEKINIEAWSASIETSSQVKLKNSLLRREKSPDTNSPLELLRVNFDPLIVNLLRESKYFILLGLSIPDRAAEIFKQAEVLRRHTGNLDLIVNMYNDIQTSLLPVERPLVKLQLDKLDKTLSQGFSGDKGAVKPLNWKSSGIEAFIAEAMAEVKDVNDVVQTLQENLKLVEKTVTAWKAFPLFERQSKTELIEDFILHQASTLKSKLGIVTDGGHEIHRLIRDTNKRLKVSQSLPDWKSYVDFVNNAVCFGLIEAMAASLIALSNQLDPVYIEKNVTSPLLEIQLDLSSKVIVYVPEVGYIAGAPPYGAKTGIKNVVEYWIEGMFGLATGFSRVDSAEGSYLREISDAVKVRDQLSVINSLLQSTEDAANRLRNQFQKYEHLWSTDLQQILVSFLHEALEEIPVRIVTDVDERRDREPERKSSLFNNKTLSLSIDSGPFDSWIQHKLDLSLFSEKIVFLLTMQDEISEMKSVYEIDFIKINAQPAKQAISTWVTKGLYTYTHFLQNFVNDNLMEIYTFLTETNSGLDQKIETGQRESIMYVMSFIRAVKKRMPEIFFNFQQIDNIISLLKKHSISIDLAPIGGLTALDFLDIGKAQWDALVNKSFRVKAGLQSLQMSMVDGIVRECAAFEKTLDVALKSFRANGPFQWMENKKNDPYAVLDRAYKEFSSLSEQSKQLIETEDLFELHKSQHLQLTAFHNELTSLKNLWDLFYLIDHVLARWRLTLWSEADCDSFLVEGKSIEDQLHRFPSYSKEWEVYKLQDTKLKNTMISLPFLKDLHSQSIRERHWKSVSTIIGVSLNRGPSFALSDLLDSDIYLHIEALNEIVEVANKELKIESRLTAIEEVWIKLNLGFEKHKESDLLVLKPPDEILEILDDHSLQLQNMAGMGKFVDNFREQVLEWQTTLGEVEANLNLLITVSKMWASLESIFLGSDDIRTQLPEDAKRFDSADKSFKALMNEMQENTFAVDCCSFPGRDLVLQQIMKELEKCEYSLNEYLEVKKNIFPRFYFVSNAALLDILSNSNSPAKVGNYIGSLFDGIGKLDFCMSGKQKSHAKKTGESIPPSSFQGAKAMISKDKERIDFPSVFEMNGNVERWLNELVSFTQATLRGELSNSMEASTVWDSTLPGDPRDEWVFTAAAQICLLATQIVWTDDVEKALEQLENGQEEALKKYAEKCTSRIDALIKLVQDDLDDGDRVKIINVITSDVHCRDIVLGLINKKVESAVDFNWQSQLRFYWDSDPDVNNVTVRIMDFSTLYSFEYVGNCSRLVITPLTDRCYVTLTVALKLFLGGAPSGPAGTGKTETTKDLSRCLGVACYVFNCSNQMNYKTLGDIFKGLTQVGAWGCFDEFNRIEIEVLSVVASQVRCILKAIAFFSVVSNRAVEFQHIPAGSPPTMVGSFDFFGYTMNLIPTVGFFITMNPGYAGRSELPENLKSQFRSCAMVQPDFLPIAENMLMAEGFVKARPLSVKFVTLYRLSSELLSKQHHYDWGLRAMKSVLRVAGVLKRADADLEEEVILMRALRDFNSPKIPNSDLPIFLRLISDIFPGVTLASKGNDKLKTTCTEICATKGKQATALFVAKVIQFQEILNVRHSVMLLGPPGSGKSTVWRTLSDCHNYQKSKLVTVFEAVNPKAVTTDELYGYMTLTKDWRDGIVSSIMRNMSNNISPYAASQSSKWVVLDGDIDAVWIESMNTVMDDNKMLTLVSNERIPLSDSMRMVFEVHSLKNATPATVSRAGILYLNDSDIGYLPYVASWLNGFVHLPDFRELKMLFESRVPSLIDFLRAGKLETAVPLSSISMIQSLCQLFDGILATISVEKSIDIYIRVFAFSAMWAFGGALLSDKLSDYRRIFTVFFKEIIPEVKFPDDGSALDFFIDFADGTVSAWNSRLIQGALLNSDSHAAHIFVPTVDSIRLSYLMDILVKRSIPVMFVGAGGTGKTILVNSYLSSLVSSDDKFKYATISMNFYTDSYSLQKLLEQSIDKRSGKTYGPPSGRLIYFIDDLNLPFVETYGSQTPMALMRQHLDYGAWYDRIEIGLKKSIVDCQYIACMNQKNGSFFINPRLQRHFVTFVCNSPGDADLTTIFGTILSSHLFHFTKGVHNLTDKLIEATLAVHKEIQAKFLPSAHKFYYNFTMREISSVVRGLLNAKPHAYKDPSQVARLWYHETMRVYSDRLMSEAELSRFRDIVVHAGKGFVEESLYDPFAEPCIFANFLVQDTEGLPIYLPCEDQAEIRVEIERQLSIYNESNPIMELVFFQHAIQHITRISRILLNGGSAMFCGVGGSGKQSLSKMACFICKYHFVQLSMTNEYSLNNFKEDLRVLFHKAAIKPAEPIMFLLNDDQILDERFLVCVNDILSTARVSDLFTTEEYDTIFATLRGAAKAEGVPDNRDSMMKFFTNRIRTNLLIVLCFSPVGEQFRQRARKFPGIFNCTSINWLHEWPKDALISVAQKFLRGIGNSENSELSDSIAYHMAEVHVSVGTASSDYLKTEKRYNYTTPKSFLELISFYCSLLDNLSADLNYNIKRLLNGLDTLLRTNQDVAELQEALKYKKVEVEAKKAATDALLEEMGQQRGEAEIQQGLADNEKQKADIAAGEARKLEEQAADDLALAKPALDAANDAVHCLDKMSMTELKSFNKPPAGVDKVTSALLIMIKGEKKDFSWENAKKMMAKVDAFKEKLETYRGEDIPEDVVNRVSPFLNDPDFTYDKMKSKSAAAANLCNWVVNIIAFNSVYKRVKPLMESLEVASKAKMKAESDLAQVEEALAIIEGKLSKLQSAFVVATQEKAGVEMEAKQCSDRLLLAERLTTGLGTERERWETTVEALKLREGTLPGDVMLAASFTSYVGAFSAPYRQALWKEVWLQDLMRRDIPLTPNITPLLMLADESTIAGWQNDGLPADKFSFENGAILTNCTRWPLLVDPQLQGIKWLKRHAENRSLSIRNRVHLTQQNDTQLLNKLTNAIRAGDTLIIENIGEVFDASLRSIIAKSMFRKGRTLYIKIGDSEVEYDKNFKLYLQTKMSSPHYKPEIFANCTIINFIVTKRGLEDQLLAVIVSEEEPSLEKTKNELVQASNNYKIQLKSLEDNILERLANAPADILGDTPLIEGLEATKVTADEISAAVQSGKIAEVGINEAREVYRSVAGEAALLYFIILQLHSVDHMYQYSLDSFAKFFIKAIRCAAPGEGAARVINLTRMLRWVIYKWVARGLFERHRLLFLVQLTIGLLQKDPGAEDWGYSAEAFRFLLTGPRSGEDKSPVSWMTDSDWSGVKSLSNIDGFEKLAVDLEDNAPRFLDWYQSISPETEKLPGDYRELDKRAFLKLLIIRILRPDRITAALGHFICHYIPDGKEFLECDSQLSAYQILESSFEDSTAQIPLYFLLSPGADIASNIDRLALKLGKVKGQDYHNISLGQGQEDYASEKLESGKRHGHWIFLDNLHLMPRWLAVLEKKLDENSIDEDTHPAFRILLSSDPSETIPIAILNRCIKITSDPPTGMKPNLKQALASFPADMYNDLEPRSRGILFGLCHFHAIMVERKKFGSKGFNMIYPFAIGDLVSSAAVMRNYMESAPARIPWVDLRYIFGEIMYGGHIINDFDRLVASTYLDFFMKEDLLSDMSLFPYNNESLPGFRAPSVTYSYDRVLEHIEDDFSEENPNIFGLHSNAEIGYRTQQCTDLLQAMLNLSSTDGSGLNPGSAQQITETIIQDTLDNTRGTAFDTEAITASIRDIGPFQNFLLQECQRMNILIEEISRSLVELDQGFRGELMMSESMEELANALFLDRVPKSWEFYAFPSMRNFSGWMGDLQKRIQQLSEWIASPSEIPRVVWISGLFNPQSFLTAVMQITSQAQGLELDKLSLVTEVTRDTQVEDVTSSSKDGANIIGLSLEGASWNTKNSIIDSCKPKQMFSPLPIIFIKPAIVEKFKKSFFICPVYKTLQRGPTYVFSLQLRSNQETEKWILAGVAAVMDVYY